MTRRSPEELPLFRWLQKQALETSSMLGEVAVGAAGKTMSVLRELDSHLELTGRTKKLGDNLLVIGKQVDEKVGAVDKAKHAYSVVEAGVKDAARVAAGVSQDVGLTDAVETYVVSPAKSVASELADAVTNNETLRDTVRAGQDAYGAIRGHIKPYFRATDAHELLRNTKVELSYISACILQIGPTESSTLAAQFSKALTAKVAGAGSTTALLALVSSLGSASTGTAIATLSGAAATKATLAWVGGMVGGGMAAGAFLTGGASIIIGLAAYKALASERRPFESLTALEQRFVQTCWMLIAVCDSYLAKDVADFRTRDARFLLDESFKPLYGELTSNVDALCAPLDVKNAIALRQHVLHDFQGEVLDGFEHWLPTQARSGQASQIA